MQVAILFQINPGMLKSFLSYRAQLGRVILLCVINLLITLSVFADYTIPQGVTVDASTLKSQTGVLTIYGKLTVSSNVTDQIACSRGQT